MSMTTYPTTDNDDNLDGMGMSAPGGPQYEDDLTEFDLIWDTLQEELR